MELNKVYQGDCLELMKEIPDSSIDFVCADLPFGITSAPFDIKIDLKKFWEQVKRITKKNAAIALFANGKFLFELGNSNLPMYRYKIVVEKDRATGFLNAHKMPLKCHEDILIFYQKLPTFNPQYFYGKPYKKSVSSWDSEIYRKGIKGYVCESDGRRHPRDVIKFNFPKKGFIKNSEKVEHPTQKPVALLEYLIKTYTREGEIVLDTCVGSGTTAIAAINTGRKFIGFELNEKFFNIACERVKQAQDKLTLDFNGVIKVAE